MARPPAAQKLYLLRKKVRLTQRLMATGLNVGKSTYERWEKEGPGDKYSWGRAAELLAALGWVGGFVQAPSDWAGPWSNSAPFFIVKGKARTSSPALESLRIFGGSNSSACRIYEAGTVRLYEERELEAIVWVPERCCFPAYARIMELDPDEPSVYWNEDAHFSWDYGYLKLIGEPKLAGRPMLGPMTMSQFEERAEGAF